MEDLDDIKFAVKRDDGSDEIIAFFEDESDAMAFLDIKGASDHTILYRNQNDFYIDIQVETSSSFDVRV